MDKKKYILIFVLLIFVIGGGIFAWQYFGVPKEEAGIQEEKINETADWQLKTIDNFSFDIYKGKNLVKTVMKEEIADEFKRKYGNEANKDFFLTTGFVFNPVVFVYDTRNQRILIPLTPVQLAGSTYGWDFYVFDVKTNNFYIAPGKRWPYNEFPKGMEPSKLTISPNGQYLAYQRGSAGGTCVLSEYPAVMNLDTFASVNIDNQVITDALKKGLNLSDFPAYFSFTSEMNNLSWDSNETLRAEMVFDGSCMMQIKNAQTVKTDVFFAVNSQFLEIKKGGASSEEIKTPEEVVKDETMGWKNYQNEEYNYELEYPSNWQNFGELWGGFNITSPTIEGRADNRIVVSAEAREGAESNQEYINNMIRNNTLPGYQELNMKKEITINEIKGYEIIWNMLDSDTGRLEEKPPIVYLEAPLNNKARFIIFNFQGKGSQYGTNFKTFDQMLSTFRFLN